MNRLIAQTILALCVASIFFSFAFTETIVIDWKECRVSDKSVLLSFENAGLEDIKKYSVALKIFDNGRLVNSATLTEHETLKPKSSVDLVFPITRPLEVGKNYQVTAFVQSGSAQQVMNDWRNRIAEKAPLKPFSPSEIGLIAQPIELRKPIKPIDIKSAMGIP